MLGRPGTERYSNPKPTKSDGAMIPLLKFNNARTDLPGLQDFGDEAIRPCAFPVKRADSGSGDDPSDDSSEHVGHIMRSDIDARRANQQGGSQEAERPLSHAMKQKARRDGKRRGGVIGGERPVAAAADDQVTYTGIVRTDPMDIEKDDLVEPKSDDE